MSKVDSDLLDNSLDNSGDGDNILGMVDEGSFGSVEEKPQLGSHVLFDTSEEEGGYNFREQAGITQYRLVHMAPSDDDAGISAILQSNSESGSISPTVQTVLTGAGQFYVIGNPSEVFGSSGNAKVLPRETQSTTKAVTKKRDDRRRATHNEVERRRRDKINSWITRLAKLVPATVNPGATSGGADGQSKGGILAKACDYITELTENQQRVRNQRKRVHITLELPWSADKAIQQFGRTHRSNQAIAPEYKFLVSQLAGERRFVSTVAKRLESLGALTHGDRHSTNTHDLSQFNIDNKYGRTALEIVMHAIVKSRTPLVPPPQDYAGDFFQDVARALLGVGLVVNRESKSGVLSLDKDYKNISKFLNRILGMPVEMQNRIFKYFTDTLAAVIRQARDSGDFDHGILDLGTSGHNVSRVKLERFMCHNATGVAPIELHTVHVERGIEWSEAMEMFSLLSGSKEGFYLSHQVRNGKHKVLLAVALDTPPSKEGKKLSKKDRMYQIYMPDTGKSYSPESLRDLRENYQRVEAAEARSCWQQQLTASLQRCNHSYWGDKCRSLTKKGSDCEVGLRRRTYHVLSGSVLAVWPLVERVLSASTSLRKMQLVILKLTDGVKIVGIIIPNATVGHLAMAMDKT